ncbi:hypothetical protein [Butyrivibrio sp. LC3010]|uniref:hypothetical protein n=1 Tax=Butyrivibrio sp. LC3010 TaxID=1280680 RepID=UPI00041DFD5D|nr:hypothetical protein [Butyrivibrio sp. LC3010]
MIVEINSVEIGKEDIVIEATNLETIFTSEDLYEELDEEKVKFVFSRHDNHGSALKYLIKVCQGRKKCQSCKSMGDKLEKLVGSIISLSESFIER